VNHNSFIYTETSTVLHPPSDIITTLKFTQVNVAILPVNSDISFNQLQMMIQNETFCNHCNWPGFYAPP